MTNKEIAKRLNDAAKGGFSRSAALAMAIDISGHPLGRDLCIALRDYSKLMMEIVEELTAEPKGKKNGKSTSKH